MEEDLYNLEWVPETYKTQKKCNEAVKDYPYLLKLFTDQCTTQEMYNQGEREDSRLLEFVSTDLNIQEMCNRSVKKNPWSLIYAPNRYLRLPERDVWITFILWR